MTFVGVLERIRKSATVFIFLALSNSYAHADWYHYALKVECSNDRLRIIDYSAYENDVYARLAEPGVIDVNSLSTWRMTEEDLHVPDKPLPYVTTCSIPPGKYEVVLTNSGGRWSWPFPEVNVRDVTHASEPKILIDNLSLEKSYEYKSYEIIFSSEYPKGKIIGEKLCSGC